MGFYFVFLVVRVDYDREAPLSPLLFVVVMEVLSRIMSAVVDNGLLSGFFVGARNPEEMIV
jgi:hypothetical protein